MINQPMSVKKGGQAVTEVEVSLTNYEDTDREIAIGNTKYTMTEEPATHQYSEGQKIVWELSSGVKSMEVAISGGCVHMVLKGFAKNGTVDIRGPEVLIEGKNT